MSASGQLRTWRPSIVKSARHPKAEIDRRLSSVRYVPGADNAELIVLTLRAIPDRALHAS